MSRSDGLCEFCDAEATLAIFAKGYPAPQAIVCPDHVERWKEHDQRAPGSTGAWDVVEFDVADGVPSFREEGVWF